MQTATSEERCLVVEMNAGQMIEDVRLAACGAAEVIHYGVGGGYLLTPDEIYDEILRFDRNDRH